MKDLRYMHPEVVLQYIQEASGKKQNISFKAFLRSVAS